MSPRRAPSLSTLARSFTSKMANAPTDALRAWGAQKGLDYLGEGESRAVFALPDGKSVVKFVFSYYGEEANRDEARAWREASPRVRALLVPVLDADPEGRWLVMERVTPADVNARTPHDNVTGKAVDALLACGFADINYRNLSSDGRLLDYGKHIWTMWGGDCVALPNPRRPATSAMRTDPELWEEVKAEVTRGSKGGKPGQWSARKAQLAVALYKARGGDYYGPKSPYNALAKWTREDWRTKSGRPSLETGERYLPAAAIAALTPAEYAATTRAKRAGMKKGQQFVPQPETVAKKVRRYRRNPVQNIESEGVTLEGAYGTAEDLLLEMALREFAANTDLFFDLQPPPDRERRPTEALRVETRRVLRSLGIDPKARGYGIDYLLIRERGKGSGSRVVREIEQTLRDEGEQVVFLVAARVFAHVRHARGFWARMGYTEVPGNYEPLEWEGIDKDNRIMFKVLGRTNPARRGRA
jgi:GNAT superfamily N-acetyltransferase